MSHLSQALELGGTKCIAILARGSTIIERFRVHTTMPSETLPAIADWLRQWSRDREFKALGLASFGPIDLGVSRTSYGEIVNTPKPGWAGTNLLTELSTGLDVPVGLATDVGAAALAEREWGAADGCSDLVYLTIGTGVGGGIVTGSVLAQGVWHPEIGHVRVRCHSEDFAGCCPIHGDCLEGLVAGPALAARTGIAGPEIAPDHPVWGEVASEIAELFAMLVLTVSPERIVLGGGVANGNPQLIGLIRSAVGELVRHYPIALSPDDLERMIVPAALGNDAGPLGATVLARRAIEPT